MGAVVGIHGVSDFGYGEPDAELVGALKALLASAESGRVRAVAFASIDLDRTICTSWPGTCDEFDMVAALSILKHRFMNAREAQA